MRLVRTFSCWMQLLQTNYLKPPIMSHYATFDEIRVRILISVTERSWRQGERVETCSKGPYLKKIYSCSNRKSGCIWCISCITLHFIVTTIIIIIAIVLSPGGSDYFTCIQNMKLVTNKFKSGGLHEKHVVATWNLRNNLSICL